MSRQHMDTDHHSEPSVTDCPLCHTEGASVACAQAVSTKRPELRMIMLSELMNQSTLPEDVTAERMAQDFNLHVLPVMRAECPETEAWTGAMVLRHLRHSYNPRRQVHKCLMVTNRLLADMEREYEREKTSDDDSKKRNVVVKEMLDVIKVNLTLNQEYTRQHARDVESTGALRDWVTDQHEVGEADIFHNSGNAANPTDLLQADEMFADGF